MKNIILMSILSLFLLTSCATMKNIGIALGIITIVAAEVIIDANQDPVCDRDHIGQHWKNKICTWYAGDMFRWEEDHFYRHDHEEKK